MLSGSQVTIYTSGLTAKTSELFSHKRSMIDFFPICAFCTPIVLFSNKIVTLLLTCYFGFAIVKL